MIPFGVLGVTLMYFIHPCMATMIMLIPENMRVTLYVILLVIYIMDNIVSFIILLGIRNTIIKVNLDNTEEITKKVREIIKGKSYLLRRTVNAFPDVKAIMRKRSKKR